MILIPDIIESVVTKTWDAVEASLITNNSGEALYHFYLHGTPLHIAERVVRRAKSREYKNKRFPLIALVHNYEETFNDSAIYNETDLTLWLMNIGGKNADYSDRYDNNFVLFLYPLWEELIKQIKRSGYFHIDPREGVNHTKIDRPNWGLLASYGNEARELGERVDGIELNLKLKLNYTNCMSQNKRNIRI